MRSLQQSRRGLRHVTVVFALVVASCSGTQVATTVARLSPGSGAEAVASLKEPSSTVATVASRSLESTLVVALTLKTRSTVRHW